MVASVQTFIARRKTRRSAQAAEVRMFRQKYGTPKDYKFVNMLMREKLELRDPPPLKPTPANLLLEAREGLEESRLPIRCYQSEYYSFCGMEDAAAERRHESHKHALLCYRAYLTLAPDGERDAELDAELAKED